MVRVLVGSLVRLEKSSRHRAMFDRRPLAYDECLCRHLAAGVIVGLLYLAVLLVPARPVRAHGQLTRVSPDTIAIQLEHGSGSVEIFFSPKTCTKMPEIQITDAVGTTNTIPRTDIHFSWETQFSRRLSLAVARLEIKTQSLVLRNTEYKGRIFFIWEGEKQAAPQVLDFTAEDRSTATFELFPEQSDIRLGAGSPADLTVRIKNTGSAGISSISISSLELSDGATKTRTTLPTIVKNNLAIAPDTEEHLQIKLPQPAFAGTYSGAIDVLANGRERKSLLLTLRTRGPNFIPLLSKLDGLAYLPRLPFVLFVLTILVGFGISRLLEDWFAGGGLQRATNTLSLLRSRAALKRRREEIRQLDPTVGALPHTGTILDASLVDLDAVLREAARAETDPQFLENLARESKRFADRVLFTDVLWTAVQSARKNLVNNPEALPQVLNALDGETPNDNELEDLAAYRARLQNIVKSAVTGTDMAAAAPRLVPSARALRKRIRLMDQLYRLAIWVVVFVIAYQTFYASNFAFGTFMDYLAVLMWSFGLTQTGTQIVQRVKQ